VKCSDGLREKTVARDILTISNIIRSSIRRSVASHFETDPLSNVREILRKRVYETFRRPIMVTIDHRFADQWRKIAKLYGDLGTIVLPLNGYLLPLLSESPDDQHLKLLGRIKRSDKN
jgi:hypothetical protein